MHACMHVCAYMHIYGSQRATLGTIYQVSLVLETGSLTNRGFTDCAGLRILSPRGPSLCFPSV